MTEGAGRLLTSIPSSLVKDSCISRLKGLFSKLILLELGETEPN